MKRIFSLLAIGAATYLFVACNTKKEELKPTQPAPPVVVDQDPPGAPAKQWKEHWFEHIQVLNRVSFDTSAVVYYDDAMDRKIVWPKTYMADAWNYTKKTYGKFGDDPRLFVIFHAGKYGGGHPSTYLDASHDFRNVTDCGGDGLDAWSKGVDNDIDLSTHEIGHIVEGASKGVLGSPAFDIWHDSKWMEIYQYDVYVNLNRTYDAERWFNKMQSTSDNFPRANTKWFKDWFFPIYNGYGKTKTLNGFFTLLSQNFPKHPISVQGKTFQEYDRKMNFGEFIHFWSGAANANLEALALKAFGSKDEKGNDWAPLLAKAKKDYPAVTALYQ